MGPKAMGLVALWLSHQWVCFHFFFFAIEQRIGYKSDDGPWDTNNTPTIDGPYERNFGARNDGPRETICGATAEGSVDAAAPEWGQSQPKLSHSFVRKYGIKNSSSMWILWMILMLENSLIWDISLFYILCTCMLWEKSLSSNN